MTTLCHHSKAFPPMSHLVTLQGNATLHLVARCLTSVASVCEQVLC